MKTGFGLIQKSRALVSYINLLRFNLRKSLLGFDHANVLLTRLDKYSLQYILKKKGANLGRNCDLESGQTFHNCKNYANLSIGNDCHVGKNCFFDLREKIQIHDNVTISMECKFITHQDLGKSNLSNYYPQESHPVSVRAHAFIGSSSVILMGCTIGENSIIAAGSLVRNDIPSNHIFGGSPAKEIKQINS